MIGTRTRKAFSFLFVVDIYIYGEIMGNFKGVFVIKGREWLEDSGKVSDNSGDLNIFPLLLSLALPV